MTMESPPPGTASPTRQNRNDAASDDTPPKCRLVILISGRGSNMQAIVEAADRIATEVRAVISNRADAAGLEFARRAGVPTRVLDHRQYPDRETYDRALMALIDGFAPNLVALAGFMRILTPAFVQHYRGRLLNIHPALLPAYKGLDTHRRVLQAGDKEHGASVHFVTEELDGGPVVLQAKVPVVPGDTPEQLAARVLEQEHRIYPEAIHRYATGRLRVGPEGVYLDGRPVSAPASPIDPEADG